MKTNKGIKAVCNNYRVTAVAATADGPKLAEFDMVTRDAARAKKLAAEHFGVKPSAVAVSVELRKQVLSIDCGIADLTVALDAAGIGYVTD